MEMIRRNRTPRERHPTVQPGPVPTRHSGDAPTTSTLARLLPVNLLSAESSSRERPFSLGDPFSQIGSSIIRAAFEREQISSFHGENNPKASNAVWNKPAYVQVDQAEKTSRRDNLILRLAPGKSCCSIL